MISGWNNLQMPVGSEGGLGRGTFTIAPPSISNRSLQKEQTISFCRSYGERGGFEPKSVSILFPEPRTTLVDNLVGALINATEILNGYAHSGFVSAAFRGFLGFEALSQEHRLAFATDPGHADALPYAPYLQLLFHEKSSYGSSAVSTSDGNLPHGSLRLASRAHALHSARSSSSAVLGSGNIAHGHRKLSVETIRSSDGHPSHHSELPSSSEEDLLLQEARFKDFKNKIEPSQWKGGREASFSDVGKGKGAFPSHSNQAKVVTKCESQADFEGHADSGKAWLHTGFSTLPQESSLFWGGIALCVMFLAGAFLVTCRSSFITRGQLRRSSVKRRILKSQWYGNPGSESWGHRNFEMRISEFPKYPLLEVDGDKKLLRFPSDRSGSSATFGNSSSHLSGTAHADYVQPIGQVTRSELNAQMPRAKVAPHRKPIRQTIMSSNGLPVQQGGPSKAHQHRASNGTAFSDRDGLSQSNHLADETRGLERSVEASLPRNMSAVNDRARWKATSCERSPPSVQPDGKRLSESLQESVPAQRTFRMGTSRNRIDQSHWRKDDELNLDRRIQKLYQTIQSVEQHRRAAMLALEEERQRSMALEEEMSKQREASAVLGEEVRLLKESHSALLTLLRKKYSTSAAARTAADLVYQDWERHAAAE